MKVSIVAALAFSQWTLAQLTDSATTTTEYDAEPTESGAAASSTDASGTSTDAVTHTVSVGGTGHTFFPDVVQAGIGSVIEFAFYPTNHSVIRAEYKHPCIPYELTGVDKIGFTSGFKPVDAILADPPTFSVTINDTEPIFFYCSAPGSCIDWQMVGVINPNANVSLEIQKEFAANASFMLQWGEQIPDEAAESSTTSYDPYPTSTGSGSTSTATSDSNESGASASNNDDSNGLSTGAIAGISIGAAAVAIAAAGLLFYCGRKSRAAKSQGGTPPGMSQPPAYVPPMASPYDNRMSMAPGSPSINKHASMNSQPMPMTDAFGNYVQPGQQFPQGYAPAAAPYPPHLAHLNQHHQPHTPPADIFGNAASPAPYPQPQHHEPMGHASEIDSVRGSSPATVATAPHAQAGGIEAFLQRQSHISEATNPGTPPMSHQSGPVFEMSGTGTVSRDPRR